ncbi:protein of unknown function [Candidatus Methylocalor cossyra]|uniref:Uncharacterized protein n=1 Tax=Candidatus Methylocalor cossyra TaxID=3108543 RepID=A0ABP1CB74_9GAMM
MPTEQARHLLNQFQGCKPRVIVASGERSEALSKSEQEDPGCRSCWTTQARRAGRATGVSGKLGRAGQRGFGPAQPALPECPSLNAKP